MPERFVIQDLQVALRDRMFPTVTLWNRLEARPRAADFDRSLRVEVRDPLWMIARQWQLGELRGDDAGSPMAAKIQMATTRLTGYSPAGQAMRRFPEEVPLEAQVEQRPLPFEIADRAVSLDLRLLMGRQWLKMLPAAAGDLRADYRREYPIPLPDPDREEDAHVVAHLEGWQRIAAVAERMVDGHALYRHLAGGGDATSGIAVAAGQEDAVRAVGERFVAWFEALFLQPDEPDEHAWRPPYLEYQFACSAPVGTARRTYVAEEYYHGRLDWPSVDVDPQPADLGEPPATEDPQALTTESFIPVEIAYEGMPNTRWWAFEDRKTNFGDVDPNTTELGKLLFLEFGLVYANDWFLLPHPLPAGSIAEIRAMVVTNVFGERTWIDAAGRGTGESWQRWTMFGASRRGEGQLSVDNSLLLLPTVPKVQEGRPLEEVAFVRDEMANMVWAVESTVPLPSGESKAGSEAAHETRAFHERIVAGLGGAAPTPADFAAPIRHRVMSSVPENWIPFAPVHVEGSNREIQLQRAAMPRIIEGDDRDPKKVEPRTVLLREGLDLAEPATYYVHEEEVPRAGARLHQSYQRTRWYGGRVVTWLGTRKQTGRGSGSSGLVFDYLQDAPRDDGSTEG